MKILDRTREAMEQHGAILAVFSLVGRVLRPLPPAQRVSGLAGRRDLVGPARVSVIIPCFNYGRFLPEAVASALDQRGVDVQVVIVDDASTDDSLSVAELIAAQHPGVVVLKNQQNCGHVVTFNKGYAVADGDYIVRLDADDLLTRDSLVRAVQMFQAFPSVGLVYGHPRHFTGENPPVPRSGDVTWTVWKGGDWIAERCRLSVNCITTPEAVVRASVMASVGALRTELRFAQDMEMWLRVAAVSDVGWLGGSDQALHRDHEISMSVTSGAGIVLDLVERRTVFQLLFDAVGDDIPNFKELLEQVRANLAQEALKWACHAYDLGKVARVPVDELVEFAEETWPDYRSGSGYRALVRRRRVGPRWSRIVPIFFGSAVARTLRDEFAYARWVRSGV